MRYFFGLPRLAWSKAKSFESMLIGSMGPGWGKHLAIKWRILQNPSFTEGRCLYVLFFFNLGVSVAWDKRIQSSCGFLLPQENLHFFLADSLGSSNALRCSGYWRPLESLARCYDKVARCSVTGRSRNFQLAGCVKGMEILWAWCLVISWEKKPPYWFVQFSYSILNETT